MTWQKYPDVEPRKDALIAFKMRWRAHVSIGVYSKDGFVAGGDLSEGYVFLSPDTLWIEVPSPNEEQK